MKSMFDRWYEESSRLKDLDPEVLGEVRAFADDQLNRIKELVKIGMALSAEKNLDRLLEMIVSEARRYTNADGGTLYIRNDSSRSLEFTIVQSDSLGVRLGGTGGRIDWQPVPLFTPDGRENHANVCAFCALKGETINIADVYDADGFDFQGTREFDASTGYRSRSMLLVPLRDHEDEVIGVLQLLNCRNRRTGEVIPFPDQDIHDTESLASQAAIAVTNMRLVRELENLFNSFLRAIAAAIDEKSPYTSGHVERVAELSEELARRVGESRAPAFADVSFSEEELKEIRMAAWMHDVGKITTPEYVVDKATKLETIFDRIELVRLRAEILKRDIEIARLKSGGGGGSGRQMDTGTLERDLAFIEKCNIGGEFMDDDSIDRLRRLGGRTIEVNGETQPFLNDDELKNLSIRKGTLTDEERAVINNHVTLTIRMLEKLPFPRKLRRVPLYAGMHHEKLDGSGYPRGLLAPDIPLPARILAIADVFEALTAADRPYKPGKMLSESVRILEFMVRDGHLDSDLCDLLVESGLVIDYARRVLSARQIDDFVWRGRTYRVAAPQADPG